jgi:ornithine lipid hydroxylase
MLTKISNKGRLRIASTYLVWPGLFGLGMIGTGAALASDHPLPWFVALYLSIALGIGMFERLMPHERQWLEDDRESLNDIAHTLLNKGSINILTAAIATFAMGTAEIVVPAIPVRPPLWPADWPLFAQVPLGLIVAELGLYIAHRGGHVWRPMWLFHALHHSVTRLWVVNTGRFHIVDTIVKIILSQTPLYLLGAPLPVFLWVSAVTAFIGLLTHCNIDVRTGPFDLVFCTPRLHRWHHSKVIAEGNMNYGENLMLWDQIFGTYFNPPRRRPPADIGIDGRIATGFLPQLAQPFTARGIREILGETPLET